ncbi:MAG: hypothetical protein ACQEP5_08400 [Actinomycetota bacterium]
MEFEGYSYRTGARFGSRVAVRIKDGCLIVTGPRIGPVAYRLWILVQVLVLLMTIPALVLPLIYNAYWYLLLIPALLLFHLFIGGVGAAVLWEAANLASFGKGQKGETVEIPLGNIGDVMLGKGWARKGLWMVIPYVVPLVDKAAEGFCVSFEASQYGNRGKNAVFAFHMQSRRQAEKLKEALSSKKEPKAKF